MCRDLSSYLSCRSRTLSPNVRSLTVELSDNGNMQGDALELPDSNDFYEVANMLLWQHGIAIILSVCTRRILAGGCDPNNY